MANPAASTYKPYTATINSVAIPGVRTTDFDTACQVITFTDESAAKPLLAQDTADFSAGFRIGSTGVEDVLLTTLKPGVNGAIAVSYRDAQTVATARVFSHAGGSTATITGSRSSIGQAEGSAEVSGFACYGSSDEIPFGIAAAS